MSKGGLRKHQDDRDRFVIIPSATIDNGELSFRARGLLGYLLNRPDGWDVRSESLAASTQGEGRDAIRTALRELGAHGHYRLERRSMRDGTHEMGTAISKHPVPEWIEQWREFGGKPVPVREQNSGAFIVVRKDPDGDGTPVSAGQTEAGKPGPGAQSAPGPENPAPAPGPGNPASGEPASGDPEAGGPGASTSTESQHRDTVQVELLRSSTRPEDHQDLALDDESPANPEAVNGKVIHLKTDRSAAPDGDLPPPRGLAGVPLEPGGLMAAGDRPTREESNRARDVAHVIATAWWDWMKAKNTPIVANEGGKPFMALRSAIATRLVRGYGVNEIKCALAELYQRRHIQVPSATLLDGELVARRKGLANGAPVPQSRNGKATASQRANAFLQAGEALEAEMAAGGMGR
jgi:hypothetical protein